MKKNNIFLWNLLVLSMLVFFIGCEQKEQMVEGSPAPTGDPSVVETPLPMEVTGNQLFYAEGMESISINEKELTTGKEVDMTVQTAEIAELYCSIGREEQNPQMDLNIWPDGESEIHGIDLVNYLGEGFLEDDYPIARSGFDYQMAWYDFNQDGKKELIFACGDKHTTLVCSVFQLEVTEESLNGKLIYELNPKTILEIQKGVHAYVKDNNEICVVDTENNISKLAVP